MYSNSIDFQCWIRVKNGQASDRNRTVIGLEDDEEQEEEEEEAEEEEVEVKVEVEVDWRRFV